jgi:hypothetical protein
VLDVATVNGANPNPRRRPRWRLTGWDGDGSSGCHAWYMRAARCVAPSVAPSAFAGFRFPPEVITLAVPLVYALPAFLP